MPEATAPEPTTLGELVGDEQLFAGARSQLYALFAHALGYPDDELSQEMGSGDFSNEVRERLAVAAPALTEAGEIDWDALASPGSGDALAVEYTRLFDAGASGPPCPLYGGLYGDARMKTMEECVRFYNHFGLSLSEEQRELPDHLLTQLEFLHVLTFREVQALQQQDDPAPFRRAQRDFIARHPGSWLPKLDTNLGENQAAPFFTALLGLVGHFVAHEGERLVATT